MRDTPRGTTWRNRAAAALAVLLLAGTAIGAENRQDEVLNFDRSIKESVDNFRILRTDNKAAMNDYVTRVFELRHAKCMEVLPYVKQAVSAESGSARTLKYVDPVTKKERNFIQVVCPKFQVKGIEQLIRAIDLPGLTSSPGDVRFFYRMQHRSAADVNVILRASELSGEGGSAVDAPTNTIYFRDSASDFSRGMAVVKFMDVPIPQVEFEIEIYELDRDEEDKLGLYWDAWKKVLGGGFLKYCSDLPSTNCGYEGLFAVGGTAVAQFLNYLVEHGAGKVITRTRISVQNGETATLSSLKRIPFQAYGSATYSNGNPVTPLTTPSVNQTVALRELTEQSDAPNAPGGQNQLSSTDPASVYGEKSEGIYLAVTPTIGVQTLSANITVTVNSLVGFTRLEAPIIAERRTTTKATLTPGKVFLLGGMDKETIVKERRYVPLLGDIPVLGRLLFSYNTEVARKSVLVITLRPVIRNQLLYKSLSIGWGKIGMSPAFTQGDVLRDNPAANATWGSQAAGSAKTPPAFRWGPEKWRTP